MNTVVGIFEAKTKLSEICDEVARTHVPVTITRRGDPLVCIGPVAGERLTLRERRVRYMAGSGASETDDATDFEPAPRSREQATYRIED